MIPVEPNYLQQKYEHEIWLLRQQGIETSITFEEWLRHETKDKQN